MKELNSKVKIIKAALLNITGENTKNIDIKITIPSVYWVANEIS